MASVPMHYDSSTLALPNGSALLASYGSTLLPSNGSTLPTSNHDLLLPTSNHGSTLLVPNGFRAGVSNAANDQVSYLFISIY